jgi:hypothetical protein
MWEGISDVHDLSLESCVRRILTVRLAFAIKLVAFLIVSNRPAIAALSVMRGQN